MQPITQLCIILRSIFWHSSPDISKGTDSSPVCSLKHGNEDTRNILKDYSTFNRIYYRPKNPLVYSLVYTVTYAFLDKYTRSSTVAYKKGNIPYKIQIYRMYNTARTFNIRISERNFIHILLHNMKNHKFYKGRIESFLTVSEPNPSSLSQKWIENKFHSLDEETMFNSRNGLIGNSRFSL